MTKAKTASRTRGPTRREQARELLEELYRVTAQDGTAVDGMTKEEVIAHMRRVREKLWNAQHAYRPRRQ